MDSDFQIYYATTANIIQKQIDSIFAAIHTDITTMHPYLSPLLKTFKESVSGGKMIRGFLVMLGYSIATEKSNAAIYPITAAFEILHASLLIHDDIIDKSLLRRGKKTVHYKLGGTHYALSQSICLADMGFFIANKTIATSDFPSALKIQALTFFSEMMVNTIAGEMLDVRFSQMKNKKKRDVLLIHKLKTAYYTIIWPLIIGATLGGAKKTTHDALALFGESLGLAFQIHDDILGVFGEEHIIGKSAISDIAEGKNTLLITHALQKASEEQKKILKTYYGKGTLTKKQHKTIKKIFIETGSLAYSQQQAKAYVTKSKQSIPLITKNVKLQKSLTDLAEFIIARKK
ncbi:MAG TPA: polyprenyl synthetase family protein [Methylomirabilota bacterium]|nr:polyprenyl synthetase family protein [Methylomirabilota bacterium]